MKIGQSDDAINPVLESIILKNVIEGPKSECDPYSTVYRPNGYGRFAHLTQRVVYGMILSLPNGISSPHFRHIPSLPSA